MDPPATSRGAQRPPLTPAQYFIPPPSSTAHAFYASVAHPSRSDFAHHSNPAARAPYFPPPSPVGGALGGAFGPAPFFPPAASAGGWASDAVFNSAAVAPNVERMVPSSDQAEMFTSNGNGRRFLVPDWRAPPGHAWASSGNTSQYARAGSPSATQGPQRAKRPSLPRIDRVARKTSRLPSAAMVASARRVELDAATRTSEASSKNGRSLRALAIARGRGKPNTVKRYSLHTQQYIAILKSEDFKIVFRDGEGEDAVLVDLAVLDRTLKSLTEDKNEMVEPVVSAALNLVDRLCGEGGEGLSPFSSADAVKSAVVAYWDTMGERGEYRVESGVGTGNPGKSLDLRGIVKNLKSLESTRIHGHSRSTVWAMTHMDLARINARFFDPIAARILAGENCESDPEFQFFIVAVLVTISWHCGIRMGDLLHVDLAEIHCLSANLDDPIQMLIHDHKLAGKANPVLAHMIPYANKDIDGCEKFLVFLMQLRMSGISSGRVFQRYSRGRFHRGFGSQMTTKRVGELLKGMCLALGMRILACHSPRRGFAGFQRWVLGKSVADMFACKAARWASVEELNRYSGLLDEVNAYELLYFVVESR